MPTASQYARYRQDRTTIWVSKAAHAFLSRERDRPEEGVGVVLDRLLRELRQLRRAGGGAQPAASSISRPRAGAARGGARKAASTGRSAAKRSRSRA